MSGLHHNPIAAMRTINWDGPGVISFKLVHTVNRTLDCCGTLHLADCHVIASATDAHLSWYPYVHAISYTNMWMPEANSLIWTDYRDQLLDLIVLITAFQYYFF